MNDETREYSLRDDVSIGVPIGLILDKKFFQKDDSSPELYAGFVTLIASRLIGISTTHPNNLRHGYDPFSDEKQKQGITKLEISHYIQHYFSLVYPKVEKEEDSIIQAVHIGDLVMLTLDGKFFGGKDGLPEKYAGFVTQIEPRVISVSTTHHSNRYHGYTSLGKDQNRVITRVGIDQILNYNKIDILLQEE